MYPIAWTCKNIETSYYFTRLKHKVNRRLINCLSIKVFTYLFKLEFKFCVYMCQYTVMASMYSLRWDLPYQFKVFYVHMQFLNFLSSQKLWIRWQKSIHFYHFDFHASFLFSMQIELTSIFTFWFKHGEKEMSQASCTHSLFLQT